jgi:hypothetical protein
VSQDSINRSFDDLARALAEGSISRRRALKLFVATALATLVPARFAGADDDDDRECKERGERCGGGRGRCCGQLQCREGRCRRPRTTTTSTTTSTTSTSTTTVCLPDGSTCSNPTDCCSGNCSNGFCCASGYVGLSNGTCAKPCTLGGRECTGCLQGCTRTYPSGETYCSGSFTQCSSNTDCLSGQCDALFRCVCTDDTGCPSGQFCVDTAGGQAQVCQAAC